MKRFDAYKVIVDLITDELVVTGSFGPAMWELYSLMDRDANFYMYHSMGLCSSISLGLALAQPKRKVVDLDNDGAFLMNLGSLATIPFANVKNLVIVVIDNECYETTGGQPIATSGKTKLDLMAKAAGFPYTAKVDNPDDLKKVFKDALNREELSFIVVKVERGIVKVPEMKLEPQEIKYRFRKHIES